MPIATLTYDRVVALSMDFHNAVVESGSVMAVIEQMGISEGLMMQLTSDWTQMMVKVATSWLDTGKNETTPEEFIGKMAAHFIYIGKRMEQERA